MRHEQKRILCTAVAAMVTSKDGAKAPKGIQPRVAPWEEVYLLSSAL